MKDNLAFQNELLNLAEQGFTLIVESRKLAHQLQWRYRQRLPESGRAGWDQPAVVTLNDWAKRFWEDLWPETWPAPAFSRWRMLSEIIEDLPPPQPLDLQIPLVLQVDETVEHCLRYGLDPGGGGAAGQLVEWRRTLWKPYHALLSQSGMFHPASLPEMLFQRLLAFPSLIPEKLVFVGFEFAGYWEKALLKLMGEHPMVKHFPLPLGVSDHEALVCANPEQELYALLEDLTISAEKTSLHALAVVLLAPDSYTPSLTKLLSDLFGMPLVGNHAAYNLSPNRFLVHQPLFQAALLPIAFAVKDEPRTLLLSLLRSPYYRYLGGLSRLTMQWDWIWRTNNLDAGLRGLMDALGETEKEMLPKKGQELLEGLGAFLEKDHQTGCGWVKALQDFWGRMEFPVLANECDEVGWQALQETLSQFGEAFGRVPLSLRDCMGWLVAAAEKTNVQERGFEDAGIQIIGGLDARGLAFERVYIPGLIAGTLPQPVQPFPFLSREERNKVQGGTVESQYAFGRLLFNQFSMMTRALILSRPLNDAQGEKCLPSPFWSGRHERMVEPTVPWRHTLPALQRARWVGDGLAGISMGFKTALGASWGPKKDFSISSMELPGEISVSRLEILLSCPMRFFIHETLGIEPLTEVRRGLDPRLRGQFIHAVLKHFGERVVREESSREWQWPDILQVLNDSVAHCLTPLASGPWWTVERIRLVGGEDSQGGLLSSLLKDEWGRLGQGWRWHAFEAAFHGLPFQGSSITVSGRLDRVDVHPEGGVFCWDYKTGAVPGVSDIWEKMTAPQLPVYLIALAKGLIPGVPEKVVDLGAGYIDLRSVAQLKHGPDFQLSDGMLDKLKAWEDRIGGSLNRLEAGDLSPCWLKDSCEAQCPYECFCGILCPEEPAKSD